MDINNQVLTGMDSTRDFMGSPNCYAMKPSSSLDTLFEPENRAPEAASRIFTTTGILITIGIILLLGSSLLYFVYTKNEPKTDIIRTKTRVESTSKTILIDISGAVIKPGVYNLEEGSRIQAAIEQAEGFAENADAKWVQQNLNLAKLLRDGDKIYIPFVGEKISSNKTPGVAGDTSSNILNINTASNAELEALPKIGPVSAQKIIDFREQNGGFTSVDDLAKVEGIGENTVQAIRELIDVR